MRVSHWFILSSDYIQFSLPFALLRRSLHWGHNSQNRIEQPSGLRNVLLHRFFVKCAIYSMILIYITISCQW